MPNFVERFSADMKESLFRAAIDQGKGVRGALRAAKQGELEGLSAEHQAILAGMTEGYAYDLVKEERGRRSGVTQLQTEATATVRDMTGRILALADKDLKRMEREKTRTPVDAKQLRELQAVLANARTLLASIDTEGKAPATTETTKPKRPQSFAERIAAKTNPETTDNSTALDASGNHDAPGTNTTNENTSNNSTSAVRLIAAQGGV